MCMSCVTFNKAEYGVPSRWIRVVGRSPGKSFRALDARVGVAPLFWGTYLGSLLGNPPSGSLAQAYRSLLRGL